MWSKRSCSVVALAVLVVTVPRSASAWGQGARGGTEANYMTGDAVVATVTKVSGEPATNANPPWVELEVHEVLQGDAKADRSKALWAPLWHGVDWGDGRDKDWEARPL